MKLGSTYKIKPCTCGCEHPVLRQDTDINGKPAPGGYILCGKCGRRTRKHEKVQKCILAWISSFDNEFFNEFSLETKILRILCKQRCFLHGSWYPLPCTLIAQELGEKVYRVRKAMHNLVEQGYAEKRCYTPAFEDVPRPIHGWQATEKAHTTQVYEDAAYAEAVARENCFQIPRKQTLKELIPHPRRYLHDI